ncbi:MAG: hypothetical protein ACJAS1_002200 [Oleiphilaceae bacterium]|jgi:hypothetical protein
MTIGIVARGKGAGAALVNSLHGIEHVAEGAIGGFVSLIVIDANNKSTLFECQTGGVSELFAADNSKHKDRNNSDVNIGRSLLQLPTELLESNRAALISSGPHRPSPLKRFLAWDTLGNLVTGHRFPQTPTDDGTALNQKVLEVIQEYGADSSILNTLLNENAKLDAGYVLIDAKGTIFQGDTLRVKARGDTANALISREEYAFGITLNSIYPKQIIVDLLCEKLKQELSTEQSATITVDTNAVILISLEKRVEINVAKRVTHIYTPEKYWFKASSEGALLETGTLITQGGKPVGRILEEPYVVAGNGQIMTLSGEQEIVLRHDPFD